MNKFLIGLAITGIAVAAGVIVSKILKKDDTSDYDDDFDYSDSFDDDEIEFDVAGDEDKESEEIAEVTEEETTEETIEEIENLEEE